MSDLNVRAALRAWKASPSDPHALQAALVAHKRAGLPLPWALLLAQPRWERLRGLVAKWWARPLTPERGCTPEEIAATERRLKRPLPEVLSELYRLVGQRPETVGLPFAPLQPLDELEVSFGRLQLLQSGHDESVDGHEAERLWIRAADLNQPDPPVFYEDEDTEEQRELGPASEVLFALLVSHVGTAYGPSLALRDGVCYGLYSYEEDDETRALLEGHYPRLPLPAIYPLALGDAETILIFDRSEGVWACARDGEAWDRLRALLPEEGWEEEEEDPLIAELSAEFEGRPLSELRHDPRFAELARRLMPMSCGTFEQSAPYEALLPEPDAEQAATFNAAWERIERWLSRHAPEVLANLAPGADPADLDVFCDQLALELPPQVRALWLRHDGQLNDYPALFEFRWFRPLEEALAATRRTRGLEEFDWEHELPPEVDTTLYSRWWINFAGEAGGDDWFLDFSPSEEGTPGQVIEVTHNADVRVLAPSLTEFFQGIALALEAGLFEVDESG
ncbi:MAG TPA: hypothetical protein DEA08_01815, partial [Planctomycetes bacterium]|nr:hypothetical protein [Planctomycetota bacterium]